MRIVGLLIVIGIAGCRTTATETSNIASEEQFVAADEIEAIRCDEGENVIEVKDVELDGVSRVGVIGIPGVEASVETEVSYTELKTVPVTYSWSFRSTGFSLEVNTKDNRAGTGVLVTGEEETTQRVELPCVLKSAGQPAVASGSPGQPVEALDTSTVRSIACKSGEAALVKISDIGRLSEDADGSALLVQKGIEILPDQFEIDVSVREEESNPVQYVWTGAYRESFVEVTTFDMVSGKGVMFADAAGEIQRVELECKFNE